ncbi:MAG: hypothetical protein HYX53_17595 [Chloroflexi bacterium]|nr:hypothetical protein [Chloroflexota bacterium]
MSDYFTRLAERALGATPVPRPVIPSRFERASGGGFEEEQFDRDESEQANAAPTPSRTSPTPAERDSMASATESTPPVAAPGSPVRASPRTESAPPARPERVTEATAAAPAAAERTVIHQHERLVIEREAPRPAPVAARAPEPPRPPAPVQRLETRPFTPPAVPSQQGSAGIRRETAGGEPPVIHVTIGRVDVRAISGPAMVAPAARADRRHRPSLEDYLHQGGREGRR